MEVVLAASSTPGLLAAFGAGVLSFLSPCVLPLVPGYLSLMSGLSYQEVSESSDRSKLLFASLTFVAGFALVFVAFGAVASSLGALLSDHRLWLERISGVLIIIMGLVVAQVFQPMSLMRDRRFFPKPATLGPYAAPIMGMAFAFGWTPCIGPILASVLALAAARDTLSQGVLLLVAYSVGLGVPFVLSALGMGRLKTTLSWFSRHSGVIDRVAGALLIIFGVLLVTGQLTRISLVIIDFWTFVGLDRLTVG